MSGVSASPTGIPDCRSVGSDCAHTAGANPTTRVAASSVPRSHVIDENASDLDGDGLTAAEEKDGQEDPAKYKSDPNLYDTDGDGWNDKEDKFHRDPKRH